MLSPILLAAHLQAARARHRPHRPPLARVPTLLGHPRRPNLLPLPRPLHEAIAAVLAVAPRQAAHTRPLLLQLSPLLTIRLPIRKAKSPTITTKHQIRAPVATSIQIPARLPPSTQADPPGLTHTEVPPTVRAVAT